MAPKTRGDRLSTLGDATLTRVLSHLPTDEAVRTSVLSRRWRSLYAAVPVVDVVDAKRGGRDGNGCEDKPMCLEQKVTCALLSREPTAPIRAFRLDAFHPTSTLLDQWIVIALRSGAEELDVKLRYHESSRLRLCPFGPYEESSADFDEGDLGRYVRTPAHLFRSATLRHLSLARWTLDFPRDVSFMSLETLVLQRIMGSGEALQRLVSSSPRLTDLTLEECPSVTKITVTSACLRSFSMVCCHNATRIVLDSRRLRSMCYKGGLPPTGSFISIASHATIAAVTIDICEDIDSKMLAQVAPVTELIGRCGDLEFLHLTLRPAMVYYNSLFTSALRLLPRLRHLELKGCLNSDRSVGAVSVLLQNTPNLEVLSLFTLLPDPPEKKKKYLYDFEVMDNERNEDNDPKINYGGHVHVPKGLWKARVRCFNHRLRRIILVGYRGRSFERMLAKFLLSKAVALEELSVSMAPGCSAHRSKIASELTSWRFNRRSRVTFV